MHCNYIYKGHLQAVRKHDKKTFAKSPLRSLGLLRGERQKWFFCHARPQPAVIIISKK